MLSEAAQRAKALSAKLVERKIPRSHYSPIPAPSNPYEQRCSCGKVFESSFYLDKHQIKRGHVGTWDSRINAVLSATGTSTSSHTIGVTSADVRRAGASVPLLRSGAMDSHRLTVSTQDYISRHISRSLTSTHTSTSKTTTNVNINMMSTGGSYGDMPSRSPAASDAEDLASTRALRQVRQDMQREAHSLLQGESNLRDSIKKQGEVESNLRAQHSELLDQLEEERRRHIETSLENMRLKLEAELGQLRQGTESAQVAQLKSAIDVLIARMEQSEKDRPRWPSPRQHSPPPEKRDAGTHPAEERVDLDEYISKQKEREVSDWDTVPSYLLQGPLYFHGMGQPPIESGSSASDEGYESDSEGTSSSSGSSSSGSSSSSSSSDGGGDDNSTSDSETASSDIERAMASRARFRPGQTFIPMSHRPYLRSMFPHDQQALAHSRREVEMQLHVEIFLRRVQAELQAGMEASDRVLAAIDDGSLLQQFKSDAPHKTRQSTRLHLQKKLDEFKQTIRSELPDDVQDLEEEIKLPEETLTGILNRPHRRQHGAAAALKLTIESATLDRERQVFSATDSLQENTRARLVTSLDRLMDKYGPKFGRDGRERRRVGGSNDDDDDDDEYFVQGKLDRPGAPRLEGQGLNRERPSTVVSPYRFFPSGHGVDSSRYARLTQPHREGGKSGRQQQQGQQPATGVSGRASASASRSRNRRSGPSSKRVFAGNGSWSASPAKVNPRSLRHSRRRDMQSGSSSGSGSGSGSGSSFGSGSQADRSLLHSPSSKQQKRSRQRGRGGGGQENSPTHSQQIGPPRSPRALRIMQKSLRASRLLQRADDPRHRHWDIRDRKVSSSVRRYLAEQRSAALKSPVPTTQGTPQVWLYQT